MRVKSGTVTKQRHSQILKAAKGGRLARSKHIKAATEHVLHQGQYAYTGRRLRKRDFRRLWITRINAGLSQITGAPSYSVFINSLKQNNVIINRKMLADLAVNDQLGFQAIVVKVWGK